MKSIYSFVQCVILNGLVLAMFTGIHQAIAQGTAFTYQGSLLSSTIPASGSYDFTFSLYTVSTGGTATAGPVTNTAITVKNGLFTTTVDFSATAFTGATNWLQVAVRTNGSGSFTNLSPRDQILPTPYAIYASTAGTAGSATTATTASNVAAGTITAGNIASNQLVKSLNGLKDIVTLAAGTNIVLGTIGNTLTVSASGSAVPGWSLTGNGGTAASTNFVGTTDRQPLALKANASRGLWLEYVSRGLPPSIIGMNVLGGFWGNAISNNVIGATIAGGGSDTIQFGIGPSPNVVTNDYGSIGGGVGNLAGGFAATIPGGFDNTAMGHSSFAAGQNAQALHDGSFVWADDSSPDPFASTANNQFLIRAKKVGINTNAPSYALEVNGKFAVVDGLGGEMAYLGGDGAGGDVQFGSLNPAITSIQFFNAASGAPMHIHCSSITIEGGADLAEPFNMSSPAEAIPQGAVVVIDEKNPGQLKVSDQPYDRRVAGVVSGANGIRPGIQMQQRGALDSGENVALTGRVYVLVDASDAPILPGDLLTTSRTPGHAMKAANLEQARGAILGKAMTGLSQGKGMVLVLVTLQ